MGYPGKVKFPIISNHFAKYDHKGELSAVLSAIYYLKHLLQSLIPSQVYSNAPLPLITLSKTLSKSI